MTTTQVYWLTRLDGIHDALLFGFVGGLTFVAVTIFFGLMFADLSTDTQAEEKAAKATVWRTVRLLVPVAIVSGLASLFVPTTKELVTIYGISYLTQNKDAREIPAEALKVLNQKLQELAADKKGE